MWLGRWVEALLPGVVRRVLAGAEPQPRWLPRRVLLVVSADIDTTAGVGAVWAVWRPRSAWAREHTALLEWYDERWRCVGGGTAPVNDPADVDVIEVRGGGGVLSLARRLDPPRSIATAPWIGYAIVHLGRGVSHLVVGDRRIDVPRQRKLVAAWKSPHSDRGTRPVTWLSPPTAPNSPASAPTTPWTPTRGHG